MASFKRLNSHCVLKFWRPRHRACYIVDLKLPSRPKLKELLRLTNTRYASGLPQFTQCNYNRLRFCGKLWTTPWSLWAARKPNCAALLKQLRSHATNSPRCALTCSVFIYRFAFVYVVLSCLVHPRLSMWPPFIRHARMRGCSWSCFWYARFCVCSYM